MNYQIIPAQPADAEHLSQIAWQAKSYWKYPMEWMNLWKSALTISPKMISDSSVFKLVLADGEIGACIVLARETNFVWIEHLWVLPQYIGKGFGRQLLKTALQETLNAEHQKIKVIADINAVAFYEKQVG